MLYREIIVVCSEIQTEHINTAVWAERRPPNCPRHTVCAVSVRTNTELFTICSWSDTPAHDFVTFPVTAVWVKEFLFAILPNQTVSSRSPLPIYEVSWTISEGLASDMNPATSHRGPRFPPPPSSGFSYVQVHTCKLQTAAWADTRGSDRRWGISWLAEQISASQEGRCCMGIFS